MGDCRLLVLLCALAVASGAVAQTPSDTEVQDPAARFAKYQARALQDDAAAQYQLARMYATGRGTGRDYRKAREWYARAAAQGSIMADYQLGVLCYRGLGGTRDLSRARELFTRAAQRGYAGAQFMLGNLYSQGDGVAADMERAREWYRRAADNGHHSARLALAALTPAAGEDDMPVPIINLLMNVYKRDWSRLDEPAQILPSAMTRCEWVAANEFQCLSDTMFRSSGDLDILYKTRARILRDGNDGQLTIRYRNNILNVINNAGASPNPDSLGWQNQEHVLHCRAPGPDSLACTNDRQGQTLYSSSMPAHVVQAR